MFLEPRNMESDTKKETKLRREKNDNDIKRDRCKQCKRMITET